VKETIRKFSEENGYLLDPHTAVGVCAAAGNRAAGVPIVCLATAHPAKFPAVVEEACGKVPPQPPQIEGLMEHESKCVTMPADKDEIQRYIAEHARKS